VLKSERYLSRTLSSGVFDKMGVIGVGTMAEAMIAPVIGSG